jgi:ubiquinone/menaquinone biosynthesis C-methylase UbiE
MKPSVQRLYDRHYPVLNGGYRRGDGSRTFYQWIRSTAGIAQAKVLNVGAGPTPEPALRRLRGEVGRLVGVDVDPIVMTNEDLDEAHLSDGVSLPFPDGEFDFVYSDWTIEHVQKPVPFLREVRRVLKSGGQFFFRTTNRGHYVTMVAAHTPHWFHKLLANRVRDMTSKDHVPYPTYYLMNSPAVVRRNLQTAGFDQIEVELIEPYPVYLVFNPLAFRIGIAYERLVNRWAWSSRFRLILITHARAAQPGPVAAEASPQA